MHERHDSPRIGVIGVSGGWSSERLANAFADRIGERILIDLDDVSVDLASGAVCASGHRLDCLDALVVKKIAPAYSPANLDRIDILTLLHQRGVQIFSQPARLSRLINRLSCTLELAAAGIPMSPITVTERTDAAVDAVRRYGKAVLKPLFTSKARGMEVLTADTTDLCERVAGFAAHNPTIYVQQFIPELQRDLGLTFMGGEYVATYARVKTSSAWATVTNTGGKYAAVEPADEVIELARRAQDLFGLDFTCVDIAETPDGPKVFEVSAFGGFRGLLEANDFDAASAWADYVLRRVRAGVTTP
ncbi:MAG: GAK system ATP-grasp enzyme [Planctomycetota bacterium]